MYENHNLRANLQEWKNRIFRASNDQIDLEIKFFLNKLSASKLIKSIMDSAILNSDNEELVEKCFNEGKFKRVILNELEISSEEQLAAYLYRILNLFVEHKKDIIWMVHNFGRLKTFNESKPKFLDAYFNPLVNYIHDKLDESNTVLYLLEKYKKRTEWFTSETLKEKYNTATKSYEQLLEDDLRLFLFDQGVEYPFSTPLSKSGRADVVGMLDTDDPLVLEIKIFDKKKKYGIDRILKGFSQTIDYSNDYNKNVGYFLIYNFDEATIEIETNEKQNFYPPKIIFNNKTYFIFVVNLNFDISASKKKKAKAIKITENELIEFEK